MMLSLSVAQASNQSTAELVSSVNRALIDDAASAASYVEMANKLLDQQQFNKALHLYSKAILSDREIDDAFLGRSLAYGSIGKAHEAIADLNVFILRNPRHSMAHVYRGVRYMAQGNTEYAEENLQTAIKLNPKNAQAYDDLGVLYAQQGHIQKALKYFGQTLRLDPYHEMAYHNLAIAYYLLDDNEKALKSVNRAIRLMPESRDTYILKAQVLDAMGKNEQAKEVRTYAQYLEDGAWTGSAAIN
ncbi:MAG: tetratricopeptide repeat protein [Gammaproteobacteria bacterium]|nr:tetratricopeptide repeat protein [Gammaproteobacteria bacterium]